MFLKEVSYAKQKQLFDKNSKYYEILTQIKMSA